MGDVAGGEMEARRLAPLTVDLCGTNKRLRRRRCPIDERDHALVATLRRQPLQPRRNDDVQRQPEPQNPPAGDALIDDADPEGDMPGADAAMAPVDPSLRQQVVLPGIQAAASPVVRHPVQPVAQRQAQAPVPDQQPPVQQAVWLDAAPAEAMQ